MLREDRRPLVHVVRTRLAVGHGAAPILLLLTLSLVGCGSNPSDLPVTWTDDRCAYTPVDGSGHTPTAGSQLHPPEVPGCPIDPPPQPPPDDHYYPFWSGEFTVCQSDLNYDVALATGVLDDLGLDPIEIGDGDWDFSCKDAATGERLYQTFRVINADEGATSMAFLLNEAGGVEWMMGRVGVQGFLQ